MITENKITSSKIKLYLSIDDKNTFVGYFYPRKKLIVFYKYRVNKHLENYDGFGISYVLFRMYRGKVNKFRFDVNSTNCMATFLISRKKILFYGVPKKLNGENQIFVSTKYCKQVKYKRKEYKSHGTN